MPEITGVKGGMGSAGDGGGSVEAIGFTLPEMDFFGTKANGETALVAAFPKAVILRPSVVFGAGDNFFNRFGDS